MARVYKGVGVKLGALGWHGGHLHEFETAGERYGIPDPEFDWGEPPRSEQRIQLKTALAGMRSFTSSRYTQLIRHSVLLT